MIDVKNFYYKNQLFCCFIIYVCVIGDVTPDARAISKADVIVTTPEKWDGISRSWQTRGYVRSVALIIIDEIHLLGEDRGPVLEVIVSRTNFIASHTDRNLRIVGLSTALANAKDLANWLNIGQVTFNINNKYTQGDSKVLQFCNYCRSIKKTLLIDVRKALF